MELAGGKAQLHRLRLGVSDKENLEKEKRALEKNNQILSARLNDLGKTVDDLTQSQQSEKPFPQMAWMDSASNADWIKDRKAKELSLPEQDVPDLKKFSVELQHRIAQAEDGATLYFRLEDIQLLIAGLAMSHLSASPIEEADDDSAGRDSECLCDEFGRGLPKQRAPENIGRVASIL